MKPYEEFANAIIAQAVEDYRWALRKIHKDPHSERAKRFIVEGDRFFNSEWFELLTGLDGKALQTELKKEAEGTKRKR